MAFIRSGGNTISFAEYSDVTDTDQRLFEANEGLTESVVENHLIRSTARILTEFRSTSWWSELFRRQSPETVLRSAVDIPELNINLVTGRSADFTDLCVYHGLYYYILPNIADFSAEDSAERAKMAYYQQKYQTLFGQLLTLGDWYDFDASGVITSAEKLTGVHNLRRIR
jgi:hypothetical protein